MAIQQLSKDFKQLKQEMKTVVFDSLRSESETMLEGVVLKDECRKIVSVLDAFFGASVDFQNLDVPQVRDLVDKHGGLIEGQTLYCCQGTGAYLCVMLWPWQDGVHTTVKGFCE